MKKFAYLSLGLALACSSPKSDQQSFSAAQRDSLFQGDAASTEEEDLTGTDLEKSLQDQGLVDIEQEIPGIQVELKYSTEENFFKQDVYGDLTRCYLTAFSC